MRELSKNDWNVLAQLLEVASMEFANHGCNDFRLVNTPENRDFAARVEEEFGYESITISSDGKWIFLLDWSTMDYFGVIAGDNAE